MKKAQKKIGLISSILLILLWVTAFAQVTKEKLNNGWEVSYTEQGKIMDGPYSVESEQNVILRGNFVNDQPKGNWFAFSKDENVAVRYNFDNNQVLKMDQELITKATINILSNDKKIKEEARISFPLISTDYYIDYLKTLVKNTIPSYVKQTDLKIPTEVTATVDKDGAVSYQAKYIAANKEYRPKLKIK